MGSHNWHRRPICLGQLLQRLVELAASHCVDAAAASWPICRRALGLAKIDRIWSDDRCADGIGADADAAAAFALAAFALRRIAGEIGGGVANEANLESDFL